MLGASMPHSLLTCSCTAWGMAAVSEVDSSPFIPSHLADSASINGVLQQLPAQKKLTVYTAPNWVEVKLKPVALWNVMQMLWYLMAVVNLNEFICWVCSALQKNYPLMHVWGAVLQMKKWGHCSDHCSLQWFELPDTPE